MLSVENAAYGVRRLDLFGSAATDAFDVATSDVDFVASFTNTRAPGYYTAGLDFDAYERDGMIRDAAERRIEIIGEALNRAATLDPTLAERLAALLR